MKIILKKTISFFMIFFLLAFPLITFSFVTEQDYDGDGINDKIQQQTINNQLHLKIWLSSINKEELYIINPVDDNKIPLVHQSHKKGYIELDSTYYSRQGQIYIELYKWSLEKQNWILDKIITGERADPISDILIPSLDVMHIDCCFILGNIMEYKEVDKVSLQEKIKNELEGRMKLYNEGNIKQAIKNIDFYDAVDYANILNDTNLVFLNNLAFYLKKEDPIASAIILEQILQKYPNRLVVKLNLADTYWYMLEESSPKIKNLYQEYKYLMTEKGLKNKIPSRVFERAKP